MLMISPQEIVKRPSEYLLKREINEFLRVRSYSIISLLNCIGKVIENEVAELFSQYWERYSKLHLEKMEDCKERSVIDKVATLVNTFKKQ